MRGNAFYRLSSGEENQRKETEGIKRQRRSSQCCGNIIIGGRQKEIEAAWHYSQIVVRGVGEKFHMNSLYNEGGNHKRK